VFPNYALLSSLIIGVCFSKSDKPEHDEYIGLEVPLFKLAFDMFDILNYNLLILR
jgi:hypothetical protein